MAWSAGGHDGGHDEEQDVADPLDLHDRHAGAEVFRRLVSAMANTAQAHDDSAMPRSGCRVRDQGLGGKVSVAMATERNDAWPWLPRLASRPGWGVAGVGMGDRASGDLYRVP